MPYFIFVPGLPKAHRATAPDQSVWREKREEGLASGAGRRTRLRREKKDSPLREPDSAQRPKQEERLDSKAKARRRTRLGGQSKKKDSARRLKQFGSHTGAGVEGMVLVDDPCKGLIPGMLFRDSDFDRATGKDIGGSCTNSIMCTLFSFLLAILLRDRTMSEVVAASSEWIRGHNRLLGME